MPRYFLEVCYNGSGYSGSQIQKNSNSIQAELEKSLEIFYKIKFSLTGSSRTDAGVHALQNFFHFDSSAIEFKPHEVYNINSILPMDIVVNKIFEVSPNAHCRFDALTREYIYNIYQNKNPFLSDRAFYYPYKINIDKFDDAAQQLLSYSDFSSFSKKKSQVNNFICSIKKISVVQQEELISLDIIANRFLRGMVKGIVGTLLRVATEKISIVDFIKIIESKSSALANFSVPSQGLFLKTITYPSDIFLNNK